MFTPRTDGTIGPKSRQRMIDNRAHYLVRDNPLLPKETATQLSEWIQVHYEAQEWDSFDYVRNLALNYVPTA